ENGSDRLRLVTGGAADQEQMIHLDDPDSVVARAGRGGQGIIASGVHKPLSNVDTVICSEMALPLVFGSKLMGVLMLQSDRPQRFGDSDLRVMSILSHQLAVAVRNANLYHRQLE